MIGAMNSASMRMLANATATWRPGNGGATRTARVIFDSPEQVEPHEVMQAVIGQRIMTFIASDFAGIDGEENVEITDDAGMHVAAQHRVRYIDYPGDGSVGVAMLGAYSQ